MVKLSKFGEQWKSTKIWQWRVWKNLGQKSFGLIGNRHWERKTWHSQANTKVLLLSTNRGQEPVYRHQVSGVGPVCSHQQFGVSSKGYGRASSMAHFSFVSNFAALSKWRQKSMIKAQTLDMLICRSLGRMLPSVWQLTSLAYTWAVKYPAEHGIPPSDLQITTPKVKAFTTSLGMLKAKGCPQKSPLSKSMCSFKHFPCSYLSPL